jgi:hypothetical protein
MAKSPGGPITNWIDWLNQEPMDCIAMTVAAFVGGWLVATLTGLTLWMAFP